MRASLSVAVPVAPAYALAGVPSHAAACDYAPKLTPRAAKLLAFAVHPATTLLFCAAVLGAAAGYGAMRGGAIESFTEQYGPPGDLLASALGLGIDTITISGLTELKESEILSVAGINSQNSLLLLNAQAVRDKLMAVPLVRDAAVRKLYPSRVSIVITERQPFALWQKDGRIAVLAADGAPIDTFRDGRFVNLPFVVGDGADAHVGEYAALLDAAGDLKSRIKAGIRVSNRRWDLLTTDGVVVHLPEVNPIAAVGLLGRLVREARILDKDIVALDLRMPGRVVAQLTDEAGAARVEAMTRKISGKGKA